MRKQKILLAVLISSASAWCSAGVPTIRLPEPDRAAMNFASLPAFDGAFSEGKERAASAATDADYRIRAPQSAPVSQVQPGVFSGILKQAGNSSALARRQVSAGSFSSNARPASPSSYSAYTAADGSGSAAPRYGSIVASSPAPKSWAVILLLLGCVMYQGRRRQRPFGV